MTSKQFAVGIDIGGTNTRVALISKDFELCQRVQFLTDTDHPEKTLSQISEMILQMDSASICGIGMSCPGPLDTITGCIIQTPNLNKAWHGYPLTEKLSSLTGFPVYLENDANLAALAEATVGEGKNCSVVQFLTVSTGLGCGLTVNGKIFRGAHGLANEVANVILWQDGPSHGSILPGGVEAICSGTGILSRAKKQGLKVSETRDVFEMAFSGNATASDILADAENYLANFCAGLYELNDPEIMIVGGSVALKTPGFIERVEKLTIEKSPEVFKPLIKIRRSILNEDSGLLGAGILAFQNSHF